MRALLLLLRFPLLAWAAAPAPPWDEYEAEAGRTNGEILGGKPLSLFTLEASGRRCVKLSHVGDYVEFTLSRPANSLVLRYSIPDAPQGNGTDATLTLSVSRAAATTATTTITVMNLTSRYSWAYGGWAIPYSKDPSKGSPRHVFDEARVAPRLFGPVAPADSRIRLAISATDVFAGYVVIDLVDMELVGAPKARPRNSLSIVDFANDHDDRDHDRDDHAAIQRAIDAAAASGGALSVWIPEGDFEVGVDKSLVVPANVSIGGSGMWSSNLRGNTRFRCQGSNCSFADFSIRGEATNRIGGQTHCFVGSAGRGSRLSGIWCEHAVVGYWVGVGNAPRQPPTTDLVVTGCRFRNLWADGVNLCNGASFSTVEHSHFRNTGDDSVASWAPEGQGGNNTGNRIRFNTAQTPWRANCYAIYGGRDNSIEDCSCSDVAVFPGVLVEAGFGAWPFSGETSILRTHLRRAGGSMWGQEWGALVIWANERSMGRGGGGGGGTRRSGSSATSSTTTTSSSSSSSSSVSSSFLVRNVTIEDSMYSGVQLRGSGPFQNTTLDHVIVEDAVISGAGTWSVQVTADARGSGILRNVSMQGGASGQVSNEAGEQRFHLFRNNRVG